MAMGFSPSYPEPGYLFSLVTVKWVQFTQTSLANKSVSTKTTNQSESHKNCKDTDQLNFKATHQMLIGFRDKPCKHIQPL